MTIRHAHVPGGPVPTPPSHAKAEHGMLLPDGRNSANLSQGLSRQPDDKRGSQHRQQATGGRPRPCPG
jgi:hypothetical protein